MKQLWKKTLINVTIFVILFFGIIVFVLMPTYSKYTNDKSSDAKNKTTIESNKAKIDSLQQIAKGSNDFNNIYQNVNNLWPNTSSVSEYMVQIEGLAKDTGLVIDSFSIEEQKAVTPAKAVTSDSGDNSATTTQKSKAATPASTKFTMSFKSQYSSMMDLVLRMETLARLNSINSLGISALGQDLNVNVVGNIYYGK